MGNSGNDMDPETRDDVFRELSGAAKGLRPGEQLAFAMGLIIALCERVGDRDRIRQAIADARKAVISARAG